MTGFYPASTFFDRSAEADWDDGDPPTGKPRLGFTLVEMVITLLILSTLMAIAVPSYTRALDNARVARAIEDIRTIEKDIITYEVSAGEPPPTLADVGRANLLDPWNRPYEYLRFAGLSGTGAMRKDKFLVPLNSTYDLYSRGKNGQTKPSLNAAASLDDVIRANDGGFVGLAMDY